MSPLIYIDPSQDPRWDQFVESHPNGLICHLSGWKEVIERSFSHIKGYFPVLADSDNGTIRAGLPIYLVSSPITGRRLVSIPFATLSTPLASSRDEGRELLSAAIDLSRRLPARRIEVRTLEPTNFVADPRYKRVDLFKHHYLALDASPDKLINRFHRSCVRPNIRRSERNGFELRSGIDADHLRWFYRAYLNSRQRLGLPPQPLRLFEQLSEVFGPGGRFKILTALHRGLPVASIILLRFKDRVCWEFIGELYEFRYLKPTHFLLWQAIRQSCEDGYRIFDFGRSSVHNPSLMVFKQRWGTIAADLPQFWFPAHVSPSSECVETSLSYRLFRHMVRKVPKRLLPVLGELCYRHMG